MSTPSSDNTTSQTLYHRTSNPYEGLFGYSRAVKKGPFHPSSAYQQAIAIFSEIIKAVETLGGEKEDITRVRMFVTRDEDAEDVGRALKESLGGGEGDRGGPAATMILGIRFVDKDMRVEIEADAVVP
ncbi:hypothetical protein H1R20_g16016, partial [Candolleomyces eurysporus]